LISLPLVADTLPLLLSSSGIFYMEFSDFLKYFSSVSICFIRSPKEKPWVEQRFSGEFVPTAGKADEEHLAAATTKHMYSLDVTKESDVWTVMYQADARLPGATPLIDQAVMIIRPASGDHTLQIVCDTKLEMQRQTNATVRLPPGKYIILPYTSGARAAALMGASSRPYQLAVFADESSTIGSITLHPFEPALYNDVLCTILRTVGTKDTFGKDQQLWMWQARHGGSHIYGCEIDPTYAKHFSVTLDSATSTNARSHRTTTACTRVIAPGQLLLFHHLTPIAENLPTVYACDIAFKSIKS
jgi:hypothetical protein